MDEHPEHVEWWPAPTTRAVLTTVFAPNHRSTLADVVERLPHWDRNAQLIDPRLKRYAGWLVAWLAVAAAVCIPVATGNRPAARSGYFYVGGTLARSATNAFWAVTLVVGLLAVGSAVIFISTHRSASRRAQWLIAAGCALGSIALVPPVLLVALVVANAALHVAVAIALFLLFLLKVVLEIAAGVLLIYGLLSGSGS